MAAEGGEFHYDNLRYLSCHTLDSQSGNEYAKRRIARELLDAWLQKRISFEGRSFDDAEVTLTEQDTLFLNI